MEGIWEKIFIVNKIKSYMVKRMPVITIAGNDGISIDKQRKMVEEVSKVVADAYDLPIEAITVLIQAYPKENIGVAGKLLSE